MSSLGILSLPEIWEKLHTREWEIIPRGYHLILVHVFGMQGLFFLLTGQISWQHVIFGVTLVYTCAVGIAAGAHRLWSHRSYKAKLPLRILLMIMQTFGDQRSLFRWARDHRLHHKYSETDADPHNVSRGIFFTHIGWTLVKEHPAVKEKEKTIDFSDLHGDPVVRIQHKYFHQIDLLLNYAFPILMPYYMWTPSLYKCVCVNYLRFMITYNVGSLGNSVAHTWIRKPYEKSIGPADVSWLSLLIAGEGWHNFHHIFPWDYRSTDIGLYVYNLSTIFIDLMARIGWAYDLKTVPDHVIRRRAARTGDGSHPHAHHNHASAKEVQVRDQEDINSSTSTESGVECDTPTIKMKTDFNGNDSKCSDDQDEDISIDKLDVGEIGPAPWGWGDRDISEEDLNETVIKCKSEKKEF